MLNMYYKKIENVKNLSKNIEKLKEKGIDVSSLDINIASAIFELAPETIRRGY